MADFGRTIQYEVKPQEVMEEIPYLVLDQGALKKDIDFERLPISVVSGSWSESSRNEVLVRLSEGVVGLYNLFVKTHADTLILLDKSARPVAQLFKTLWKELDPDRPVPDIHFINVGRESDLSDSNPESEERLYDAHFSVMNDKVVIVADEIVNSGRTIIKAKALLEKVFPQVKKYIYTSVF